MTTYSNISLSGLRVAQMGLQTTQHNIANANTTGYSRQAIFQATSYAIHTGDGALGQGVGLQTIKRNYSDFLTNQANQSQTRLSELDALYTNYSQIDNMLADPDVGLASSMKDYFSAVQKVAGDPSLPAARQAMLASAQTLAARFQLLDGRFSDLATQVNGRIESAVDEVNALTGDIAKLNQSIVIAQAAYDQPANDLLDQRDALVSQLNKLVQVNSTQNSDGSINVSFGNGQQLVVGAQAMQLVAQTQAADASKVGLALSYPAGVVELPDRVIQGGELGGLMTFRNDALTKAVNGLGLVAASMAQTMNAQQAQGQDLYGQISGDPGFQSNIFSLSSPVYQANYKNAGDGELSVSYLPLSNSSGSFTSDLKAENYRVTYNAGAPTITRLSDNSLVTPVVSGASYQFDGIQFQLSAGTPVDGDSFLLKPVANAAKDLKVNASMAADSSLLAAAAPMRTAQTASNLGSLKLSVASVQPGYSITNLPLSLNADVFGQLAGYTGSWTATYDDGSTAGVAASGTNEVPLTNGSNPLSSLTINGVTYKVSGTAQTGDTFTIEKNVKGIQDGRNIALMAGLQTAKAISGEATFNSSYAGIVADSGIRTKELKINLDAQQTLNDQITASRESVSGVNLDEEAANLMKYQQAYQASAKALQIGLDLFKKLMELS